MIGDKIILKPKYMETSEAIFDILLQDLSFTENKKIVVAFGGESGSGKSVSAMCFQKHLIQKKISSLIFHQDDYFKFPPLTNHEYRLHDISHVGIDEVEMDLLNHHIEEFKQGKPLIIKPEMNFNTNEKLEEICYTENINVLLIEGTYTLMLKNVDYRIFMDRTYKETKENRLNRGRDLVDMEFIETVLEIEHQIIRPTRNLANIIVTKEYKTIKNE